MAIEDEDLASVARKAMEGTRLSAASWTRLSHLWTLGLKERHEMGTCQNKGGSPLKHVCKHVAEKNTIVYVGKMLPFLPQKWLKI